MLTTRKLSSSDGGDADLGGDASFGEDDRGFAGEFSTLLDTFVDPFVPPPITVARSWPLALEEEWVGGGDDSFGEDDRGVVGEAPALLGPVLEPCPSPATAARSWPFALGEWVVHLARPTGSRDSSVADDDDDGDLRRLDLCAGVPLGFPPSED